MKGHRLFIFILAVGVFGILNTEMGVIGLLPYVSAYFGVSISEAGALVSLFALIVAVSGPVMPLLMSRFERKKTMLFVLAVFIAGNVVSAVTDSFAVLLAAWVIPAFSIPCTAPWPFRRRQKRCRRSTPLTPWARSWLA